MTRLRSLPIILLTALVMLPVAGLTVAGLILLRHERERWEEQAATANQRIVEQNAENLREGLKAVRRELTDQLTRLSVDNRDGELMELAATHPLVRNVFRVSEDGIRQLPKPGIALDAETERFLHRYEPLFEGGMEWFQADADPEAGSTAVSKDRVFSKRLGKGSAPSPPPVKSQWRPWHWADRDVLLLYVQDPQSLERLGVEIEMTALYARMDVWLREQAQFGEVLALLDRRDRILIAGGELPEAEADVMVEMGPLLPFARLAHYNPVQHSAVLTNAYYLAATGAGGLMLLSIVAGTLGLTAWVHRSRREALQKTTFVSNVSHEFKTPLTTLRLYSELLLEGRITDPDKQKAYLRTMCNESERLARLVHNALDFSRLEMGRNRLTPTDIDLTDCIHRVAERLRERFETTGMEVLLPKTPCRVWADPDAAEQILLNLMDNAIKYAADGKNLEVHVDRLNVKVEVRIQDRGAGIPARERKKIFEAFHQVDDRLTRESGGTGLGLHISRRLARQMNGDLNLRQVSDGACFVWTLPGEQP
ncbi:MAG: ATP-binding protein [Kiritimatiellia bacterium]